MKRFFRITVGDYVIVRSGNYPLPSFDMSRVFVKALGYDRCIIYDERNAPIASFRLDALPPNGHLFLRSYMAAEETRTSFKRLIFVLNPRLSDNRIINAILGSILRKVKTVTFNPREFENCEAEKI